MSETTKTDLRRAILDASRQFLVENGYTNLSMRKIAGQVGCSPGTIYLYFKNKDDIFHALMDEGYEQLYNDYQAVLNIETEPLKRLYGIGRAFINFGLQHTQYYEIMYLQDPSQIARYPKEQYRRARRILEVSSEVLQECAAAGQLHLTDPFIDATVLWSAMHGITSLIITRRVDVRLDEEQLIQRAIEQAINGFRISREEP